MSLNLYVWVRSPTPGTYAGTVLIQLPGVTARSLQFTVAGDDARQRTYELRRRKYFRWRGSAANTRTLLQPQSLPGGSEVAQLVGVILGNLDGAIDRFRADGRAARGFRAEYRISHLNIDACFLDRFFGPRPMPEPRDG